MERILIVGNSGAGKSTMARALSEKTGLPVVHLDRLFWRENWQHIAREEFDALLRQELEKPQWIIDGNYDRTVSMRLAYCDTVIYLDYPRWQCLLGVVKRVITSYGKVRPDMADGCPERFDWEFMKYVWNYNRENREKLYRKLNALDRVNVIVFRNRKEGNVFLRNLNNSGE